MRRIGLAVVLAVSLTLAPLAAGAQQTEKARRIGFLSGTNPNSEVDDALFRQLRRCIQRPCDIRAAQAISRSGGPIPESPYKLKGLSHT
jgi:hypothetical protein